MPAAQSDAQHRPRAGTGRVMADLIDGKASLIDMGGRGVERNA
jgi:hypothetical protein